MSKDFQIHISAGLGGWVPFISSGTRSLDMLMDKMSPEWDAHHHLQQNFEEDAYNSIRNEYMSGKQPKVILGGHSMGVFRAIIVAWKLHGIGIPVEYLFAIDATALTPRLKADLPFGVLAVPKGIKDVDEFWAERFLSGPPWIARKLSSNGDAGGKLIYSKPWLRENNRRIHRISAGHIGIASHRRCVDTVIKKVKSIVDAK